MHSAEYSGVVVCVSVLCRVQGCSGVLGARCMQCAVVCWWRGVCVLCRVQGCSGVLGARCVQSTVVWWCM